MFSVIEDPVQRNEMKEYNKTVFLVLILILLKKCDLK